MSDEPSDVALRQPGSTALRATRQPDEKYCFSCGRIIHASAAACPSCGATQSAVAIIGSSSVARDLRPADAIFCYGCGGRMHVAAFACPACGAPQRRMLARPIKDRTTAIVLAFLLGGFGAHRFYLGSAGWGILYLLFCWTLIPAVVAVIEGFVYLSQTDEGFAKNYG